MKNYLTIIIVCAISTSLKAQNVQKTYQDAIRLAEIYRLYEVAGAEPNLPDRSLAQGEFRKIVNKYNSNFSEIKRNPFMHGYVLGSFNGNTSNQVDILDSVYRVNTSSLVKSNVSFGTDWQSATINGISSFMAGRFKAEALHMGLEQIFKRLQGEDSNTVKLLFPKTFKQVKLMYNPKNPNSYYTADLLFLRQLVISDLESMPENLIQSNIFLTNLPNNKRDLILTGYNLCKYTKQGYPIPKIIEKLSQQSFKDPKVQEVFSYSYLLSQALLDTAGGWVNPIQNLNFSADEANLEVRYFYGLLYEQLKSSPFIQSFNAPNTGTQVFYQKMQELLSFVSSLDEAYDLAKEKKFKFSNIDDYLNYTHEITTAFQYILKNEIIASYLDIDEETIEMTEKYLNIIEPFVKKDYQRGVPVLIAEVSKYLPQNENVKYIRSASFLAQLASIENEEDMALLLKSYSLPIGSSSIKRNSRFNISVNGYVGLTSGVERAYSSEGNQDKWNLGLTAPIGLSFTKWNTTLFISVIDLGTMINVRLNNDTSFYSGLKFENFLSPGVGLYYNIPKAPLTLGFHYSYIPSLRTIKLEDAQATITKTNTNVSRINFSVLVDIPFFTLYNSDKIKKK